MHKCSAAENSYMTVPSHVTLDIRHKWLDTCDFTSTDDFTAIPFQNIYLIRNFSNITNYCR